MEDPSVDLPVAVPEFSLMGHEHQQNSGELLHTTVGKYECLAEPVLLNDKQMSLATRRFSVFGHWRMGRVVPKNEVSSLARGRETTRVVALVSTHMFSLHSQFW